MPRHPATVLLAATLVVTLAAGCGPDERTDRAPRDSPSVPTSTAVPTLTPIKLPPPPPPSGKLFADLRQSSRDAALGRMEVWIANDTRHDVTPTRIAYRDVRFRRPVAGERLRLNPSRSERGYPLTLPDRPNCIDHPGGRPSTPTVTVSYAGRREVLVVTDDNDIVARYVSDRCLRLAVAQVADLHFADQVPSDGAAGSTGTLTLVARPVGAPGHVLRIDSVGGTPLLGADGHADWSPRALVRSDGPVRRIPLRVRPARCDDHVFMEAGGATAFLVRLHLDGVPGQLVIRMSTAGAANAIAFARMSCGLG